MDHGSWVNALIKATESHGTMPTLTGIYSDIYPTGRTKFGYMYLSVKMCKNCKKKKRFQSGEKFKIQFDSKALNTFIGEIKIAFS